MGKACWRAIPTMWLVGGPASEHYGRPPQPAAAHHARPARPARHRAVCTSAGSRPATAARRSSRCRWAARSWTVGSRSTNTDLKRARARPAPGGARCTSAWTCLPCAPHSRAPRCELLCRPPPPLSHARALSLSRTRHHTHTHLRARHLSLGPAPSSAFLPSSQSRYSSCVSAARVLLPRCVLPCCCVCCVTSTRQRGCAAGA